MYRMPYQTRRVSFGSFSYPVRNSPYCREEEEQEKGGGGGGGGGVSRERGGVAGSRKDDPKYRNF